MSEEEKSLDGNRPAPLHNGAVSTDLETLQDTIMAWHKLRSEQAQSATIRVIVVRCIPLPKSPRLLWTFSKCLSRTSQFGGQNVVLFARCASVWGRASIDWTGGGGTRDFGDDKSGEPS